MKLNYNLNILSPAIGATIDGVDLRDLSEYDAKRLYALTLEHKVVAIRGQSLSPLQLAKIANLFGPPVDYPFAEGFSEAPSVIEIVNSPDKSEKFSSVWHTDTSYLENPPELSFLYAVQLPRAGGDTVFSNSVVAFDSLSPPVQQLCRSLTITNVSDLNPSFNRSAFLNPSGVLQPSNGTPAFAAVHPLVYEHPETGELSLYASMEHTRKINEVSQQESNFLLTMLHQHICRHEHTCRIRWERGMLLLWDNRTTQHRALNDYVGESRTMWRTMVRSSAMEVQATRNTELRETLQTTPEHPS